MQDEGLCPVCHQSNGCQRTNANKSAACWCDKAEFPDELLAGIREPDICICEKCLQAFKQSSAALAEK